MSDERRWIEFLVDKDDLMVLELAVRHVDDEYVDHCVMLNEESEFEYAGNIRQLKAAINRVCKPESDVADSLRARIEGTESRQDKARGEV